MEQIGEMITFYTEISRDFPRVNASTHSSQDVTSYMV
jgi:hypothetical protein